MPEASKPSPTNKFGSFTQRSSVDPLMINTTRAQDWMPDNVQYNKHTIRLTMMGNDIDGAFNCVNHEQLITIFKHFKFLEHLVDTIKDFNTNRSVYLAFEGQEGDPASFNSGVLQGLPI